jgi:hypothetical protein
LSDILKIAERVLALDAEATTKPWRWDMESYRTDDGSDAAPSLVTDDEFAHRPFGVLSCDGMANAPGRADRELIAEYRTSAPALAREVKALTQRAEAAEAEVARLREALGTAMTRLRLRAMAGDEGCAVTVRVIERETGGDRG